MLSKVLTILRKISKIIAENEDQAMVLDEIVKVLAKNLESDVCSIYVYDDEKEQLLLTATCGLNTDLIGKVKLKTGEGITGTAFKSGEIINVANAELIPSSGSSRVQARKNTSPSCRSP